MIIRVVDEYEERWEVPEGTTVRSLFEFHWPERKIEDYLFRLRVPHGVAEAVSVDHVLEEGRHLLVVPTKVV